MCALVTPNHRIASSISNPPTQAILFIVPFDGATKIFSAFYFAFIFLALYTQTYHLCSES
jgi:hypothetical protein